MIRLLVVCLGNICRSPMGQGALEVAVASSPLAGRVQVDSAGTGGWHAGEPPDARAIACARHHGVDISSQRARQLTAQDFHDFDWILCADADNLARARALAPDGLDGRAVLWPAWAGIVAVAAIPDPYYGGSADFEQVWELVGRLAAVSVKRLSD